MTRLWYVKNTTDSEFLNLVGATYGRPQTTDIYVFLPNPEKSPLLNKDEVEAALKEAGLDNKAAIFEKVRKFPIPSDYSPLYRFEVCATPGCKFTITHGAVYYNENEEQVKGRIHTLDSCGTFFEGIVRFSEDHKLDAVILFQQMLAANLAADDEEWRQRYFALPEQRWDAIPTEIYYRHQQDEDEDDWFKKKEFPHSSAVEE